MKKEFGKWLMDIAKYITTVIILSSVFGNLTDSWIIYLIGSGAIAITLILGLALIKKGEK